MRIPDEIGMRRMEADVRSIPLPEKHQYARRFDASMQLEKETYRPFVDELQIVDGDDERALLGQFQECVADVSDELHAARGDRVGRCVRAVPGQPRTALGEEPPGPVGGLGRQFGALQ
ncbi:hypothetical protein [Streptomyces sp. 21So2-11]|uniref:hypothetical protein n=1 Tax=Streptomyces sp. 21So2-11 TaxID=3144408 RepID=UPI00321964DA